MKYLDVIKKDCCLEENDDSDRELKKKLLERSWATREFEIELYWKRAIYFWGFTATIGAALIASMNPKYPHPDWFKLLVCGLGFVLSWAWFRSSQGSKFWQENWEAHVDLVEGDVHGKLYQVVIRQDDAKGHLECAPYSVSKINQVVSLVVAAVWLVSYLCISFSVLSDPQDCKNIAFPFDKLIFLIPGFAIIVGGYVALERCKYKYEFLEKFQGDEGYAYHVRGRKGGGGNAT
ncbi:RipA family octameric membrane protein [Nitratidesulfovibrio vulgaris]|uniref:Transmembrane protein n=1 Tax=Nitratidesulfovibrio vulgaris (strain ATCC 29579 / DSM 644 / CCUG 34227 / NCIMB 8303 / VKM B-1760 / Hildenborough) TaxID=882 RepID=Q727L5_NITV2|nr:hypothetical protein [Nitratidesulfovibrio vulgaris]AAS97312.1 conserved hypothetical protein [Nitratidesulfovibrio vulgaris str. Hildenborough]ADP87764.1 hypothetical protein Deval_2622 [Nitratidesulfovibrio vulgaris RCH1]